VAVARRPSEVRRISKETAIAELERSVRRLELVYEVSSEEMATSLREGKRTETAEICFWMIDYRRLRDLQNGHRERLPQLD
jgi:hypothetical protein